MNNELKHVTFSIRKDHIELLNDLSERYALRSRSAALAFLIEEYKRLRKNELNKSMHGLTSLYADSTCTYEHFSDILKGDNDNE